MGYLHGIVADDEFEAACFYEYARESSLLRDAALTFRNLIRDNNKKQPAKRQSVGMLQRRVVEECHLGSVWLNAPLRRTIWSCHSFPEKPWGQLQKNERRAIISHFATAEILPLLMHSAGDYNAMGVLDHFKGAVYDSIPVLHDGQRTHALFTLDFGDTRKRMLERFKAWLKLPENQRKFNEHSRDVTGTTGKPKDRLKDIAVWRLYEVLGFNRMIDFTRKHQMRKAGKPIPWHDARSGQSQTSPRVEADIFSEESLCGKAAARAKKYLSRIIPEPPPIPPSAYIENAAKGLPDGP